ncbi:hypothetical protein SLE2022_118600 [Rubroshorea leprosula]
MLMLPTISVPVQGKRLKVYLSTFDKAVSTLVAQDDREQPVYYYPISDKVPGGEVTTAQEIEQEWTLYFDGASMVEELEAGIVLRDDKGHDIVFSFKFDSRCTNNTNRLADALATIALKVPMAKSPFSVQIIRKEQPIYHGCKSTLLNLLDYADWQHAIYNALLHQESDVPLKDLSGYVIISHELYYRFLSGFLARCVSKKEAYHKLKEIHDRTCGQDNRVSLYRRVQRAGYYWPDMARRATKFQQQCVSYQHTYYQTEECFSVDSVQDCGHPYID